MPEGLTVSVDRQRDRPDRGHRTSGRVGQFAANVRELRPPEPYKGKGIRYVGEHVRRKAGKARGTAVEERAMKRKIRDPKPSAGRHARKQRSARGRVERTDRAAPHRVPQRAPHLRAADRRAQRHARSARCRRRSKAIVGERRRPATSRPRRRSARRSPRWRASSQIQEVVFDRNGFLYHGRVKALADAAREAGLKF